MQKNAILLIFFTFIISIGLIGCQSTSKEESKNSTYEKANENVKIAPEDGNQNKSKDNFELALDEDKDSKEGASKGIKDATTKQAGAKKQERTPSRKRTGSFTYKTYSNSRFGFSVEYPATFLRSPVPTNNDGREFYNEDCSIVASGSHINNGTIKTFYNQALEYISSPIAYKRLGSNWYVISYKDGSDTVYEKAVIGKDIISTFKITYPSSKQKEYEPMITHISSTFKGGQTE